MPCPHTQPTREPPKSIRHRISISHILCILHHTSFSQPCFPTALFTNTFVRHYRTITLTGPQMGRNGKKKTIALPKSPRIINNTNTKHQKTQQKQKQSKVEPRSLVKSHSLSPPLSLCSCECHTVGGSSSTACTTCGRPGTASEPLRTPPPATATSGWTASQTDS